MPFTVVINLTNIKGFILKGRVSHLILLKKTTVQNFPFSIRVFAI